MPPASQAGPSSVSWSLTGAMTCDQKDKHVLAAAVRGQADALVTFNLRDFPAASAAPHDLAVQHPDTFLLDLLDLAPGAVVGSLRSQADRYKREPRTVSGLLAVLERTGARGFAEEARRHCW
ncbi:hypothetical protein [Streptomyces boninensis]|uniref:hypothetical protein n=1 Tax=Streptomyces boninensis TaxID=2039455 RepID=UPI003B20DE11